MTHLNITSRLCQVLPSALFHSAFAAKIFYACKMRATCTVHPLLRYLIITLISSKQFEIWSSSLCNFLQHPVTLPSAPNTLLGTLLKKYSCTETQLSPQQACKWSLSAGDVPELYSGPIPPFTSPQPHLEKKETMANFNPHEARTDGPSINPKLPAGVEARFLLYHSPCFLRCSRPNSVQPVLPELIWPKAFWEDWGTKHVELILPPCHLKHRTTFSITFKGARFKLLLYLPLNLQAY
jgi:hypothetical protein